MRVLGSRQMVFVVLGLGMMVSFQNCGKVVLAPAKFYSYATTGVAVDFCTRASQTIKSNLKFIFVIDRSGSNQNYQDPITGNNILGSDPDGRVRFTPIENFLRQFTADPYLHYSWINFSTGAALARPLGTDFTTNLNGFINYVVTEHDAPPPDGAGNGPSDNGWTDYLEAIQRVKTLIQADVAQAKLQPEIVASDYVVFFISDGAPFINQTTLQDANQIRAQVSAVVNMKQTDAAYIDGIQFNTAYYYQDDPLNPNDGSDPLASTLLRSMADVGFGTYFEFGAGVPIDFSQFVIPTRNQNYELKDLLMTNMSTLWVDDIFKADTDGDGIADSEEARMGSNPSRYDSDGNGVGDSIELQVNSKPCRDARCLASSAQVYTTCGSLPRQGSAPYFFDKDYDGLNDCEESLIRSYSDNFDSNNDGLPDGLAFRYQPSITNMTSTSLPLDQDYDGYSLYQEIKKNTPPQADNRDIPGLFEAKYFARKVSQSATQTCYHYDIAHVATKSSHDRIRITLLESATTGSSKVFLRFAEKPLLDGGVYFRNEDFH